MLLLVSWGIGFALPIISSLLLVSTTIILARKRKFIWLALFSVIPVGIALIASVVVTFTVLGALGPGLPLAISSILAALLSFVLAASVGSFAVLQTRKEPGFRRSMLVLYMVGSVLIPLSQLASPIGAVVISSQCEHWQQKEAGSIIAMVEKYRRDHGTYPQRMDDLVPVYLTEAPSAPCLAHYRLLDIVSLAPRSSDYRLLHCPKTTLLTVPSVHGFGVQRYDLSTDNWSGYDPLSDDPCGRLE